jgi:hypothetical protein
MLVCVLTSFTIELSISSSVVVYQMAHRELILIFKIPVQNKRHRCKLSPCTLRVFGSKDIVHSPGCSGRFAMRILLLELCRLPDCAGRATHLSDPNSHLLQGESCLVCMCEGSITGQTSVSPRSCVSVKRQPPAAHFRELALGFLILVRSYAQC